MGFGYGPDDGPAHWILEYPKAGGRHQSPVDIETELVEYDSNIHEHPLKIDFKTEHDPEAQNNGHSFVVGITEESTVTGGILGKEEYNLKQFHFHWGGTPNVGSEHTVDGKHYAAEVRDSTSSFFQEKNPVIHPADAKNKFAKFGMNFLNTVAIDGPLMFRAIHQRFELHFVSYDPKRYGTFEEAISKRDGLAVIGVFIEEGEQENKEFEKLCQLMPGVEKADTCCLMEDAFHPSELLPSDTTKYYTYPGSLTTPPCLECVTWIVMAEPILVSERQLKSLRYLKDPHGGHLENNFRPTMPLGDRVVKASFK